MVKGDETFDIYRNLWREARSAGAQVRYAGPGVLLGIGVGGALFQSPADSGAGLQIWLVRADVPRPDSEPCGIGYSVEELFNLAHEVGHLDAWHQDGDRDLPDYRDARYNFRVARQRKRPPKPADLEIVLREERRAWNFARTWLENAHCPTGDGFETHAAAALERYRR